MVLHCFAVHGVLVLSRRSLVGTLGTHRRAATHRTAGGGWWCRVVGTWVMVVMGNGVMVVMGLYGPIWPYLALLGPINS